MAATLAQEASQAVGLAAEAPDAPRTRSRTTSSTFAASAAQEYAYVVSDVRRIALVGGTLFAVMIVLFVLVEVAHVIRV